MTRIILTVLTFVALLLFPWPFAALLVLVTASVVPLIPLAAGLFADTLYYAPHSGTIPYFALLGAAVTAVSYFVRSRLTASSID